MTPLVIHDAQKSPDAKSAVWTRVSELRSEYSSPAHSPVTSRSHPQSQARDMFSLRSPRSPSSASSMTSSRGSNGPRYPRQHQFPHSPLQPRPPRYMLNLPPPPPGPPPQGYRAYQPDTKAFKPYRQSGSSFASASSTSRYSVDRLTGVEKGIEEREREEDSRWNTFLAWVDTWPIPNRMRRLTWKRITTWVVVFLVLVILAWITYVSLVGALIARLKPPVMRSGYQFLVDTFVEPTSLNPIPTTLPKPLSGNIMPKACHSHNDYFRRVPLYEALSAGCTGVEADVHLINGDLLVGHSTNQLKPTRTLASLYVHPLVEILEAQNAVGPYDEPTEVVAKMRRPPQGVYETEPETTLVLLVDFKTNGSEIFPVMQAQLEPLRARGWLTVYNSTGALNGSAAVIPGPITVVATGNAQFEDVIANSTYRYVFFDAPLEKLQTPEGDKFDRTNSYYASADFRKEIGRATFGLKEDQRTKIGEQIKGASDKALVSRYWNLPSWPVKVRDRVWTILVDSGIGMLNVDNLYAAAWWNWDFCSIASLNLCG